MAVRTDRKYARLRQINSRGVGVAIINKNRVLILKRNPLLLIALNRGIWAFVFGGAKPGERFIDAAYREAEEETGIGRDTLTPLYHMKDARMYDAVRKNAQWKNDFFIFRSKTDRVRINWEHTGYRWASLAEIEKGENYTSAFIDNAKIIRALKAHLKS